MHLNCVQLPASYLFYYKYYVGGLGINIHTYIHSFKGEFQAFTSKIWGK